MRPEMLEALRTHVILGLSVPIVLVIAGTVIGAVAARLLGSWLDRHRILCFAITLVPLRTVMLGAILYCHFGLAPHYLGFRDVPWGPLRALPYAGVLLLAVTLFALSLLHLHRSGQTTVLAVAIGRDAFFLASLMVALNTVTPGFGLGYRAFLDYSIGDTEAFHGGIGLMLAVFLAVDLPTGVLQAALSWKGSGRAAPPKLQNEAS